MAVLKSRQNDPRRNDAEEGNSEVEANADKVVATVRLHAISMLARIPINLLPRLTYAQATV